MSRFRPSRGQCAHHLGATAPLLIAFILLSSALCAVEPCCIEVVDESNGWPVPLVELTTTHQLRFVTDNAGRVAFDAPELMDTKTWFTVQGHGYSVEADGFGRRGVRLLPRPGETLTVRVRRELPAKRLGRITGGGLFAESQQLGKELDWQDQGILGCDSVQNALHDGKFFWSWGDTVVPGYPLGLFHMTGATTSRRPLHNFQPPVRLRYDYFRDQAGAVRTIAAMPGSGPTWLSGFISLPDRSGQPRLGATYSKIKPPLEVYELGLCVWDEATRSFEKLRTLWTKTDGSPEPPKVPHGHPQLWDDPSGERSVLFGDPFPSLKCAASFEAWSDPDRWQRLQPQKSVPSRQNGRPIKPHRGSIAWNAFCQQWVAIFTQYGGESSHLGEIWYAQADAPSGPWREAVQVVTHDKYTFYNPKFHPEFTPADSPVLLFEGTYTKTFSGTQEATPRYDYNQILYRLDLDDPALMAGQ